jgi:hypothetical protein
LKNGEGGGHVFQVGMVDCTTVFCCCGFIKFSWSGTRDGTWLVFDAWTEGGLTGVTGVVSNIGAVAWNGSKQNPREEAGSFPVGVVSKMGPDP